MNQIISKRRSFLSSRKNMGQRVTIGFAGIADFRSFIGQEYLAGVKVSAAMGLAFTEHFNGDIDALREAADKRMYEDKEIYYQTTGKERRK